MRTRYVSRPLELLVLLMLPLFPQLADAACGKFEIVKGNVKVLSAKTKAESAAAVGGAVCSGDTVTAAADSRARVTMEDGNELNISPNSKIILEQYDYRPEENKKKVSINVMYGKMRAATKSENMYADASKSGEKNSFQVKTKTAVAGVRGTDFMTSYEPRTNKSEVVTFKGRVEFGQPGPGGSIVNSVQVGAGQKTEMAPGQPPAPPKVMPKTELDKANSDTKADTGNANNRGGNNTNAGGDDKKQADNKNDKGNDNKSGDNKGSDNKNSGNANGNRNADNKGSGDNRGGNSDSSGRSAGNSGSTGGAPRGPSAEMGGPGGGGDSGGSSSSNSNSGSTAGNRPAGPAPGSPGGITRTEPGPNAGPGPMPGPGAGPIGPGPSNPPLVSMLPTTPGGGGTMGPDVMPVLPPMPALPPTSILPTLPPTLPTCTFCNDVIQSGPTKLRINLQCSTVVNGVTTVGPCN